ncbi:CHASE domain-containing sensor histidine kinase [Adhaeretor mobilis]|uniref:histidine kinase n=1 Tax=Adhaeretor mobilis TaxID=1930276 RepID=A0A517MT70_9BACT|nr:CHASE domain-containing protein [Adhaeretor mobilis]QDS98052.1 Phytochrome-like protein cph1 [Adhaeretor mobilis]
MSSPPNSPYKPLQDAKLKSRWRHSPLLAWLVLGISLLLTFCAWLLSNRYLNERAAERFTVRTNELEVAIRERMLEYEQVLRGGIGLFAASENVSRGEWHAYVSNSQLQKYYPGIQGMGYSRVIAPSDKASFEQEIRADGFPEFQIKPSGERAFTTSIVYLEPFDWRNQRALGYDMYSNPVRRQAMDRAIDTGLPSITGNVTLVQETDVDVQAGFLYYLPHYTPGLPTTSVEERRKAIQGFVYAAFRSGDLMHGIIGDSVRGIAFELFSGQENSADALMYRSAQLQGPQHGETAEFAETRYLDFSGRVLTLVTYSRPELTSSIENWQSLLVAIGGLIVDVLLFLVIASLSRQRQRAYELAEEMTAELRIHAAELQRSNAELEQFAYVASHDLQEPLRKVTACCQVLLEDYSSKLDDKAKQWISYAVDASERMRQMIKDLLSFSKIGRDEEHSEVVDANRVCHDALSNLQYTIDETQAKVEVANLPTVQSNGTQLTLLLQNLIGNALKYRGEATPEVHVSASEEGEFWKFRVADNGIGIEPQYRDRIFLIFQRLHAREAYQGTGIGLAICKKIVERHSGTIWLESQSDEDMQRGQEAPTKSGSVFYFTLPKANTAV